MLNLPIEKPPNPEYLFGVDANQNQIVGIANTTVQLADSTPMAIHIKDAPGTNYLFLLGTNFIGPAVEVVVHSSRD